MTQLSPTSHTAHRRALTVSGLALLVVVILWNVPLFSTVLYPLRLFVTFIHEAGHVVASVLTGGQVRGFIVYPNGAGVTYTIGGIRAIILPAGYIGTALFGAALFYIANTWGRTPLITTVLGYGLIAFSIFFTFSDLLSGLLALTIGCVMGGLLVSLARRGSEDFNLLILNVLAMITGLNAVLDVFYIVENPGVRGVVVNDAAAFSEQFAPWIPASVWALIWAIAAAALLAGAVYFSVIRPARR